ncbi:hypothetical protein BASH2_01874 [Bacillus anthracis]|nr:hypothetical protein BASH2_01874 [Bacillus anthracis]
MSNGNVTSTKEREHGKTMLPVICRWNVNLPEPKSTLPVT